MQENVDPSKDGRPQWAGLEIREVYDPQGEDARQFFDIYLEAFPAEEREPVESLKRQMREGAGRRGRLEHLWVAAQGEQVQALAVFSYCPQDRIGIIGYFAVRSGLRSQGLGAWLLQQVVEQVVLDSASLGHAQALGVALEVERPEDAHSEDDRERRMRRIAFYQREGAYLLDQIRFTAPALGPGLPEVAYHLMFLPLSLEVDLNAKRFLTQLVESVYRCEYGLQGDHPLMQQALDSLQGGAD